ncbi:MAG: tRNA lysidine(34) synthetase TilS [Phycisphaeraceae bacterium]|nr:tRNA lysidine(34) synthetase TilS [Phycisphaeraceae bacterium]
MKANAEQLLPRACQRALRQRCGVPPGARILVAVSGGADSVALIRALAELRGKRGWELGIVVGHVQHHLRGSESEGDAEFVDRLADDLGLEALREDVHLDVTRGDVETQARAARYRALASMAAREQCRWIATGHHADDQLETILMRLVRGAGIGGLAGMRWRRMLAPEHSPKRTRGKDKSERLTLVRPLLATPRSEIERYLRDLKQPWREDASNRQPITWRNRLRHEVIPVLDSLRPGLAGRVSSVAECMAQVHRWIYDYGNILLGQALLEKYSPREVYQRLVFRGTPEVLISDMLRRRLIQAGARPDTLGFHRMSQIAHAVNDTLGHERSFSFSGGVRLLIRRSTVEIISKRTPSP